MQPSRVESANSASPRGAGRLVRALLSGGAATFVDLAVLSALVAFGLAPRIANVPALLVGGIASFLTNRHWVFRAGRGSLSVQATRYAIVEVVALGLNGLLYDLAVRTSFVAAHASAYVIARLAISHLVFLGWSYPLWKLVFRAPTVSTRTAP